MSMQYCNKAGFYWINYIIVVVVISIYLLTTREDFRKPSRRTVIFTPPVYH